MNKKYFDILNNKTILVTGGTGSFGYQMTQKLLEYPVHKIRIFSRDEDKHRKMLNDFKLSNPHNYHKIEFCLGDVRDRERFLEALDYIDIVYHGAALKQIPHVEFAPMEAYKTNTIGTQNLVHLITTHATWVDTAILISTDKAVKPINTMGISKAMAEKIFLSVQHHDPIDPTAVNSETVFNCVRYGNVLGSRGSVLPVWDEKIKQNKPLPVTSPKMNRFFLTLDEATDLVLEATLEKDTGKIYVKKAPSCNILDIAKAYAEIQTGDNNYPVEMIGIRAGEKLDEILVSEEEMQHTDITEDHYKINRVVNNQFFDESKAYEYSTKTTTHIDRKEIVKRLREIVWIK